VLAVCLLALSSAARSQGIYRWVTRPRGKSRASETARRPRPGPVDGDGRWWALPGTALCAAFALVAAERAGDTDPAEVEWRASPEPAGNGPGEARSACAVVLKSNPDTTQDELLVRYKINGSPKICTLRTKNLPAAQI
jgi:hypothetical protein